MSSLKRSVRRAIARRNGRKWPERDNGQLIEKSVKGRTKGARVFDFENLWAREPNRYAAVMTIHFRHPTKRRTLGRTCRGKFMQPFTMIAQRYGLGALNG